MLRGVASEKRTFGSMTEMLEFFKLTGRQGGKVAAKRMSKAQRTARAKKAAAASATVRSAKAKAKRKKGA
jgi:uncharacterized protein YdaU (DUF1376 family)